MCVSQSRFLYEGVKHFEVSVSLSKKSKCLGLAKKNAGLAVSQSLAFIIRHPSQWLEHPAQFNLSGVSNPNRFLADTVFLVFLRGNLFFSQEKQSLTQRDLAHCAQMKKILYQYSSFKKSAL